MSEIAITGIFEKVNNIFSLFKALLTPGKFQDSVLWQKEILTILALGLCLIAAISFIAFKLINTLKKRQRNYKKLVSALEEDGVELDYNLKPLLVDEPPETSHLPTSETKTDSFEDSHKDLQFENFIEELSSKLTDEKDSEDKFYPSTQYFADSEPSVIGSSPITDKNIFSLNLNHLSQNKSNESSEADKVLHLSLANLKVEFGGSETMEKEHLVLNQNNHGEQIYNNLNDNQLITSSVIPDVKNALESSEVNPAITNSIRTDDISSGLGRDEGMETEFSDLPEVTKQDNENANDEPSICDEVESVISGFDEIESENKTTHKYSQFETYDNKEIESSSEQNNLIDSIGLEAESVINEFSDNKKIPLNENDIFSELPSNEDSIPESNSKNSFIDPDYNLDDTNQILTDTDENNSSNIEKNVEFLSIEDDSNIEIKNIDSELNSDADNGPIYNIAESEIMDNFSEDMDKSMWDINLHNESCIEPNISNDKEDISESEFLNNAENKPSSADLIVNEDPIQEQIKDRLDDYVEDVKNVIEQSGNAEQDTLELGNNFINSTPKVEPLNTDSVEIKQLSLAFEKGSNHEKPLPDKNVIPETIHKDIKNQHSQDRLSPKTAKRIIERLEFFQKNINKKF